MKDDTASHTTDHYLDTEHSTSLRKLLALILLSGVAQVGLITIMPIQVYLSFVLATLFILYGVNLIYRAFKGLSGSADSEDSSNRLSGPSPIRHITARDWRKGQIKRKIRQRKKTDQPKVNDEKSTNNVVTFKRPS
ncbi:MAG: hypothetical protein COB51_05180 [Moraxellaceae bacterium]|nr:MAG: hypothetical protein COB51_05180 [Moraxellaceae bacterium]